MKLFWPTLLPSTNPKAHKMIKRNLIYTGITRGKKLVIVVGEKKALAIAVKQRGEQTRWSSLRIRLEENHLEAPALIALKDRPN